MYIIGAVVTPLVLLSFVLGLAYLDERCLEKRRLEKGSKE